MSNLKKIIRRLRVNKNAMQIPLCVLLVNVRSYHHGRSITLSRILKQKSLHREYGIKGQLLQIFEGACLNPYASRPKYGGKTHLRSDGTYKPYSEKEELPF